MLVSVHLFKLTGANTVPGFAEWFASRLGTVESAAEGAGQQLIGLYAADVQRIPGSRPPAFRLPGHACVAVVKLVRAAHVEDALRAEADARFETGQMAALDELQNWIDVSEDKRLWLRPMVASRFASEIVPLEKRLIRIILRHLPESRTLAELVEFDARIIDLYATTMSAAKWYHIAIYDVVGLPSYVYADAFDIIDAETPEEAMANDAKVPVSAEYQAVLDECNDYLDRSRDRYGLWLTPLVLTRTAREGVRFVKPA